MGLLSAKALPLKRLLQICGVAAGLLLVAGVAWAGPPQGAWSGLVQQANTDVAVQARFRTDAVDMHFDEPLACTVPAKLLKQDGAATVYRFGVSVNGGKFCEDLQGRDLTFTPSASGRLAIAFPSKKTIWRGDLRPSPGTSP